jgi:hypothetical protein
MMNYKLNFNFPWQIILQKIAHKILEVPEESDKWNSLLIRRGFLYKKDTPL